MMRHFGSSQSPSNLFLLMSAADMTRSRSRDRDRDGFPGMDVLPRGGSVRAGSCQQQKPRKLPTQQTGELRRAEQIDMHEKDMPHTVHNYFAPPEVQTVRMGARGNTT